jgi:hypothetical protein
VGDESSPGLACKAAGQIVCNTAICCSGVTSQPITLSNGVTTKYCIIPCIVNGQVSPSAPRCCSGVMDAANVCIRYCGPDGGIENDPSVCCSGSGVFIFFNAWMCITPEPAPPAPPAQATPAPGCIADGNSSYSGTDCCSSTFYVDTSSGYYICGPAPGAPACLEDGTRVMNGRECCSGTSHYGFIGEICGE